MKAFKAGIPLSKWLLRLSLVTYILVINLKIFSNFNLKDSDFYLSTLFIVAGVFLVIGGIFSRLKLTILSSLVIMILATYVIAISFTGTLSNGIALDIIIFSIAFYFFSNGN